MCENDRTYVFDGQRFSSGGEDIVARSALRFIACAGVLTTGLLMSGVSAAIAFADTGEATGAGPESSALTSKSDNNDSSAGATGASNPDPPSSTVGNGRDDVGVQSAQEDKKKNGAPTATNKFRGSVTIPILRIPRKAELPSKGLPNPSLFYTTIVIPVPTLGDVLAAMQPPPPTPAPAPTFRTQEQQSPPVVDSSGGHGVDPLSVGVTAEPPVLEAPLVIAPLPIPLAPPPPAVPLVAAAGAPPVPVVAGDIAVAGARVPLTRGSLRPEAEPTTKLAQTTAQPTRLDYVREIRNPTVGELTVLALPGVAGLLVFTLSGGVIGYRQANSARLLRAQDAARFLR